MEPTALSRHESELGSAEDTVSIPVDVIVVEESDLTSEQASTFLQLAIQCFPDVTAEEVEEDFCRPPVARVLAYSQGELVAGAEVFSREVEYEGQAIRVGGFGPFAREDVRGQGIGTRVCQAAMNYLKEQGCDVAFLSVDTKRKSHPLYERLRFKMLARPFIYANVHGELRESDGGMIAPLCSEKLFEYVLNGEAQFALTPEPGYW
jgi:GNAT superfamily N-acetyltransferase